MAFLIINVWKFAQGLQLSLSWHSAGSSSTAAAAVLRAQQQQLLQLTSHHHLLLLVLSSGLALTELRSLYVLYKYVCTKQHSGTILPSHESAGAGDAQAPRCFARPAACAPRRRRPTPAVVPWRVSAEAALAPQSRRRRRFVVVAGVASLAAARRRRRCRRRRCWPWNCRQCSRSAWIRRPYCCCRMRHAVHTAASARAAPSVHTAAATV